MSHREYNFGFSPKTLRKLAADNKLELTRAESDVLFDLLTTHSKVRKFKEDFAILIKSLFTELGPKAKSGKFAEGITPCVIDVSVSRSTEAALIQIGLLAVVRAKEGEPDRSWIERGLKAGATFVLSADVGALRVSRHEYSLNTIRLPQSKKGIEILNDIKRQLVAY